MERLTYFVDILLPLPLQNTFTYRVPQELEGEIAVGKRMVVPFANHKKYAGLVVRIHHETPTAYITKYAQSVLDEKPIIQGIQLEFWQWISAYYLCTMGDVMAAALPSAFKLSNESTIVLNPDFDGDVSTLSEHEFRVTEALHHKPELSIDEISRITGLVKTIHLIKNLRDKHIVMIKDEVLERIKPKIEVYLKLHADYEQEDNLQNLFNQLEKRAVKQVEVLMLFIHLTNGQTHREIKRSELLKAFCASSSAGADVHVRALVKKQVLELVEKTETRLETSDSTHELNDIHFSAEQQQAFDEIGLHLQTKNVALLHGVTGSGKTEIYIKLIEQAINNGKQVLYLLPEIALTSQIIHRLRKYFGEKVGIYHSKFNEQERVEVWQRVMDKGEKQFQIVLGARSAVFMPFDNLGLVIVDEEHETSFKQYDPAPRYNARDAAIYLASLHGAKTVLGSATPSIESYFNAQTGKYGLVELLKRYGNTNLPNIRIADLKQETREKMMHAHFSSVLMNEMTKALEKKEQIILFQNRRGFSLRLECEVCNYMPECTNCDVTLTYHKHSDMLKCHYCGLGIPVPQKCPKCGHSHLTMKGFGTEKIEDDLSVFFPDAKIRRMDLDTTRSKNAYRQIIQDFEDRKIDILVGTQMVTKGLDFDNVSVVGILSADNLISFPDFRAYERSFQLMAQVSGRAGRRNTQGTVIIQTYNKNFPVLQQVIDNNYLGMYLSQLHDRQQFHYPPYFRLIKVAVKHKDFNVLEKGVSALSEQLHAAFGNQVLGPNFPLVSRINTYYIKEFLLKFDRRTNISQVKNQLSDMLQNFSKYTPNKSLRIVVDVDPQ
ncbi:MAG: primosomal protein N' [Bacteroidales bacterium]|jgi:primosomal protein N' (replication factor Y)|nr:primosomal protein N' [Bacteroidales bacterium]